MKNFLIAVAALIGVSGVVSAINSVPAQPASVVESSTVSPLHTPTQVGGVKTTVTDKDVQEAYKRSVPSDSNSLSNNNHYTNVNGDRIHSPAKSLDGGIPAGATARCGDGSYSFSQNHRGTCSHHGGVANWL